MPRKSVPFRAIGRLVGSPWAMTAAELHAFVKIASRQDVIRQALGTVQGRDDGDQSETYVRDGVAVVPFIGPAFRYSSWMHDLCGATTYDRFAQDLAAALDDDDVKAIVLEVDSPGGEVNGCVEASDMVFRARGTKPIIAWVGGDACSAAYWVASAADSIVVSDTAMLGSIGVVGIFRDDSEADAREGIKTYEIVSSQSPGKRPDPGTKAGRAALQGLIDDTAAVFVARVARNRGVTVDKVLADFGKGGCMVGTGAVEAGLADEVGNFEDLLAEIVSWDVQVSPRAATVAPTVIEQGPVARRK